ncbi:hypothetical protein GDO81_001684 [Engystomops pustulosus]|uniref:Peptidase M1 membrane alanine aminopeptidase domain-containing protein n=1 Tax=Engystomops pustulosus TaxID=76066 RepID=A0AAV7DEL7_ENGPU|nr:hypothetical protein GDO81_001684 [Engystomops pustulosus]
MLLPVLPKCLEAAYSVLGTHPFSRLDILIVPSNFSSLGMASPHIIYLSQSLLSGRNQLCVSRVCHEIAHAWFGLAIGARDWTEEWLSEGFATHLEDVFLARVMKCALYMKRSCLIRAPGHTSNILPTSWTHCKWAQYPTPAPEVPWYRDTNIVPHRSSEQGSSMERLELQMRPCMAGSSRGGLSSDWRRQVRGGQWTLLMWVPETAPSQQISIRN